MDCPPCGGGCGGCGGCWGSGPSGPSSGWNPNYKCGGALNPDGSVMDCLDTWGAYEEDYCDSEWCDEEWFDIPTCSDWVEHGGDGSDPNGDNGSNGNGNGDDCGCGDWCDSAFDDDFDCNCGCDW